MYKKTRPSKWIRNSICKKDKIILQIIINFQIGFLFNQYLKIVIYNQLNLNKIQISKSKVWKDASASIWWNYFLFLVSMNYIKYKINDTINMIQ